MKVLRSLRAASDLGLQGTVATIGVFDGVHLGHQKVLQHVIDAAHARGSQSALVTFGRHPRAIIEGRAPKLLTSLRHRLRIIQDLGVDVTLLLHFDRALREMTASEFVRRVFVDALGVGSVVLGHNNRFGRGGEGDIHLLRELGAEYGFEASQLDELRLEGGSLSSTAIRSAILKGDLVLAESLLGRPFSVLGRVVRGARLGSQLGFPTANLNVHHEVRPPRGVFGCSVHVGGDTHHGLVNIGVRPTVHEDAATGDTASWRVRDRSESIEVHILDFSGDLYGRNVELVFLHRIRGEARFDSLTALTERIEEDCRVFRNWLQRTRNR